MSFKDTNITNPGTSIKYGADDMELIARLFNGVTTGIPAVTIKSTAKWGFWDAILYIRNQADTQNMTIRGPVTMTAARDLTMPSITANDTLAAIGLTNVWGVKQQYEAGLVVKQISSPSNPSSNYHHLFMNASGHLISRTSAGVETDYNNQIFSGSSSVLKDYSARVYNTGGTYFAYDSSGNVISSGSVFETVAQAALNVTGTVLFAGPTTMACSGSFTGLDLPSLTHLVIERGCNITVPNAYTGHFLRILDKEKWIVSCFGNISEAGSPARNWICFFCDSASAGSGVMDGHITHAHVSNALRAIRLRATGPSGIISGNSFDNFTVIDCKNTAIFETSASGVIEHNMFFHNVTRALAGVTTSGYEDVQGMMNEFHMCMFMDNSGTMVEMEILSSAEDTSIIGGNLGELGGVTFSDASLSTTRLSGSALDIMEIVTEDLTVERSSFGNFLTLYHNTNTDFEETPLNYDFKNDVNVRKTFASISAELLDNTSATEDGGIDIDVLVAGTSQRVLQINQDSKGQTKLNTISTGTAPLFLYRDKNVVAADIWGIEYGAKSSTGTKRTYAKSYAYVDDGTNASEDAAFGVDTMRAGTLRNILFVNADSLWFGADNGFQVEFDRTGLTGDRIYTFPDITTRLAGLADTGPFTAVQTIQLAGTTDFLYLYRQNNSANDIIDINFDFNSSTSVRRTFSDIRCTLVDPTNAAEHARLSINLMRTGVKEETFVFYNQGDLDVYDNATSASIYLGRIGYWSKDSAGNKDEFGAFYAFKSDATSGSEDMNFGFDMMVGGTQRNTHWLSKGSIGVQDNAMSGIWHYQATNNIRGGDKTQYWSNGTAYIPCYLDSNGSTTTIISNSNAENTIYSNTTPQYSMNQNGFMRMTIHGYILQNQATGTVFTFRAKFGGVTMWQDDSISIAQSATKQPFTLEITVYAKNSETAQGMAGRLMINDASGATTGIGDAGDDEILMNMNFDSEGADGTRDTTSGTQTFSLTAQSSVASASVTLVRKHVDVLLVSAG